jgi:DNA-binding beta-propeller fold protein YncE
MKPSSSHLPAEPDQNRCNNPASAPPRVITAVITNAGLAILLAILLPTAARAQIVLSGNESKVDLTGGSPKVLRNADPNADSVSLLDFSQFPPNVTTVTGVPNTVIGPPSNIAISPDAKLALIANSIRPDPSATAGWVPESYVHVLDLTSRPPKLIGRTQTDLQPSGLSITADGRHALVANRASGTVSILSIDGTTVRQTQSAKVCEPADGVCDVAISPDGKTALASVQKPAGHLALLRLDDSGNLTFTGRKISVYGQPYRVVITPEGDLALTAGTGAGNGLDADAVTVIDLKSYADGPRAIDYVAIGAAPESIEISPDGQLLAATVMNGSNVAPSDPRLSKNGGLDILRRRGKTFVKTQSIAVGRIPEGVAFTSDGKYLIVQCHPDRQLWIFEVKTGGTVADTGQRIDVPGMPSSLRAAAPHGR